MVSPGLYAGRVGNTVKIGFSLNLPQRIASFRFEELVGVLLLPQESTSRDGTARAFTLRDRLKSREAAIHQALADKRVSRDCRPNTNEWFHFDDTVVRVLFAHGFTVARARVAGKPLGVRPPDPVRETLRLLRNPGHPE